MSQGEKSSGFVKPIIAGVVSTVLATVILVSVGIVPSPVKSQPVQSQTNDNTGQVSPTSGMTPSPEPPQFFSIGDVAINRRTVVYNRTERQRRDDTGNQCVWDSDGRGPRRYRRTRYRHILCHSCRHGRQRAPQCIGRRKADNRHVRRPDNRKRRASFSVQVSEKFCRAAQ